MAYDEGVAEDVRRMLAELDANAEERRMFGGIAFMVDGHMTVGVIGSELMVRVGKDAHAQALAEPHARVMDFTGRPSTGMVYVGEGGFRDDAGLRAWVQRGLDHTRTLPRK